MDYPFPRLSRMKNNTARARLQIKAPIVPHKSFDNAPERRYILFRAAERRLQSAFFGGDHTRGVKT